MAKEILNDAKSLVSTRNIYTIISIKSKRREADSIDTRDGIGM